MLKARLLPLASFILFATGCATTGTGSTSAKGGATVDRMESIAEISTAVCERYKQCNGFGEGKKFMSMHDCEIQQRDEFNSHWPEKDCAASGLNRAKFVECRERIKQYQCSGNLFDLGGIMSECGASKVCI